MGGEIDPQIANETATRLWAWTRKRAVRDKDLSAVLDILWRYAANNPLTEFHLKAAEVILRGELPKNPLAVPAAAAIGAPGSGSPDGGAADPRTVLARLKGAGMLRGRNGQKAISLLEYGSWSDAQEKFASDLSKNIYNSALVYVGIREMAEAGHGGRFAESMVEAFDEWGSYTPKQLDTSRSMVERETGQDPLDAAGRHDPNQVEIFAESAVQDKPRTAPPPRQAGPADDDDIPF